MFVSKMLLVWCLLPIAGVISFRGPHHPKGHYHYKPKADGPKLTQDTQLLQDVQHLQEDLGDSLPMEAVEKMSPEEMEFHYFKLHDFDNNTKLDGLEILHAIRHTLEHEQYKLDKSGTAQIDTPEHNKPVQQDLTHFIDLIDQVLYEDDTDHDGYLSYVEYVIGRQRDLQRKAQLSKHHTET